MLAKTLLLSLALCAQAAGQITSLDLANYQLSGGFDLPPVAAAEASAITYNWDTGNLLVLGDEGVALAEVSTAGTLVSTMTLTGFGDTEGLTYIGGGRYVLAEERLQTLFRFTYAAGGAMDRGSLPSAVLGPTIGNTGIEGVSYDPLNDQYFAVKEKTPQDVLRATTNFAGTTTVSNQFVPNLGVLDLSDIQVLSTVPSLVGTADQDNFLIYSQESSLLMEVSRTGAVLSTFSFAGISGSAEGVTIDSNGNIYICDESPRVYILSPIPAPAAATPLLLGLAFAARRRR
jgi:uncharacterized protein YjiK